MKERIRSIMQYMRLSQQDFANRLGIAAASLSSGKQAGLSGSTSDNKHTDSERIVCRNRCFW